MNKRSARLGVVRKVWTILSLSERRKALTLLLLMIFGMALEMLGVGLVVPAIALLMQNDDSAKFPWLMELFALAGTHDQKELVVKGMAVLVGVYAFKAVFLSFLAYRQMQFVFGIQAQISQRLFEGYLHQPYTFHLQRNSAQLISNAVVEVQQFIGNALMPAVTLITESLVMAGMCVLLLIVEPVGASVVIVLFALVGWFFQRITRNRLASWGKSRQHHEHLRLQHLQQGLAGAKDVKLLGREAEFSDRYRIHCHQSARVAQRYSTLQQIPRLFLELLAVMGISILVLVMAAQNKPMEVILPVLGLFAAAAFRLMPSMNRLLGAVQSIRYGLPAISVLYSELGSCPERTRSETNRLTGVRRLRRLVTLNRVSYTYPGAVRKSLDDITLTIRRGESVGVVGSSGAGKSTLVDTILGLLPPDNGEVLLDGCNIQTSLRQWQNQIGYVPQTIFLTDDTMRRNVAFGVPDDQINDEAVWCAIRQSQMEDFVNGLPAGLETMVGERGVRLSGGQRQRIGIARALYHNPEVLVLDEATSALDAETEEGFMEAIYAMHGTRTIIIVAHRLSTITRCDRVFRLAEGRLIDQGKFEDVAVAPGSERTTGASA